MCEADIEELHELAKTIREIEIVVRAHVERMDKGIYGISVE